MVRLWRKFNNSQAQTALQFSILPRVCFAEQMQGLRSARKRSLLFANEHFERKRNAADAREICSQRVGFAEGFCLKIENGEWKMEN